MKWKENTQITFLDKIEACTRQAPRHSTKSLEHGLSQQGVWVPFWTPKPLKSTPQDTHFF